MKEHFRQSWRRNHVDCKGTILPTPCTRSGSRHGYLATVYVFSCGARRGVVAGPRGRATVRAVSCAYKDGVLVRSNTALSPKCALLVSTKAERSRADPACRSPHVCRSCEHRNVDVAEPMNHRQGETGRVLPHRFPLSEPLSSDRDSATSRSRKVRCPRLFLRTCLTLAEPYLTASSPNARTLVRLSYIVHLARSHENLP